MSFVAKGSRTKSEGAHVGGGDTPLVKQEQKEKVTHILLLFAFYRSNVTIDG